MIWVVGDFYLAYRVRLAPSKILPAENANVEAAKIVTYFH